MKATFTTKVNIRETPSAASLDVGDVLVGDVIYGLISGAWIAFDKIYRAGVHVQVFPIIRYAAVQDPNNSATKFATLEDKPEPTPTPVNPVPTVKPLTITIGGADYDEVTVTLNPKD